jgi:hypothetical protein
MDLINIVQSEALKVSGKVISGEVAENILMTHTAYPYHSHLRWDEIGLRTWLNKQFLSKDIKL